MKKRPEAKNPFYSKQDDLSKSTNDKEKMPAKPKMKKKKKAK
jgi:hypothetical protein